MGKTKTKTKKKLTPEERKARLEAAYAKLEEGVQQITDSEAFKDYLRFLGSFHNYSANNVMLIHMQNPEATMVAGFHDWKKKGRFVRKGEKGIAIMAPVTVKIEDESTGEKRYEMRGCRITHVWDVSQTDGEPLPDTVHPEELNGESNGSSELYERLLAVTDKLGARVFDQVWAPFDGRDGMKGVYDRTNRQIHLRPGLAPDQKTKTLCHELVHHILHHKDKQFLSRVTAEVEAEGTAYAVLSHFGIDVGDYSFAYVANWAQGTKPLKMALDVIRSTTHELIEELEGVEVA